MGHRDYRGGLRGRGGQHNVMAFVGNGFDLQVLSDYDAPVDTRYASFYHFLKLRSFSENNVILETMEQLREASKENWSDLEGAVEELSSRRRPDELLEALREIQGQFSEFLNLAVPSSLLTSMGADSMGGGKALTSLNSFLGDLDPAEYQRCRFPERIDNFDLYNFVFVNFNYTPLLDDFIYLDQIQFDPLPLKTVDRNFEFEGNPKMIAGAAVRAGDVFSSYVITEVLHPHGHQSIPRSLLFGIDEPAQQLRNQDRFLRLSKPFWAQNNLRYKSLMNDAELFIIFGCSLGKTDGWWWRHIAESLGKQRTDADGNEYQPELILYWYDGGPKKPSREDVLEIFFRGAGLPVDGGLGEYIYVIIYDEATERVWLNTSRAP